MQRVRDARCRLYTVVSVLSPSPLSFPSSRFEAAHCQQVLTCSLFSVATFSATVSSDLASAVPSLVPLTPPTPLSSPTTITLPLLPPLLAVVNRAGLFQPEASRAEASSTACCSISNSQLLRPSGAGLGSRLLRNCCCRRHATRRRRGRTGRIPVEGRGPHQRRLRRQEPHEGQRRRSSSRVAAEVGGTGLRCRRG